MAVALEAYFDGLHNGDVDRFKEVWHPEGHLYWISPQGDLVDRNAEEFMVPWWVMVAVGSKPMNVNSATHGSFLQWEYA